MKNWIIALVILLAPIIVYHALDKNLQNKTAFVAQAQVGKPTVVKLYSSMCLDCKKLDSVTKEVMPKYTDKLNYQTYNVQNNEKGADEYVQKYNITLVPTMIFLKKDGSLYKKTEGYLDKQQLENILNTLIK